MSERMSTRRERKQTEKAEAATEEKAPPKEKVEKAERRQSSSGAGAGNRQVNRCKTNTHCNAARRTTLCSAPHSPRYSPRPTLHG